VRDVVLASGKVSDKDLDLLRVTDDVDDAVAIMVEARRASAAEPPGAAQPDISPHRSE
jgi:hypothetical protein